MTKARRAGGDGAHAYHRRVHTLAAVIVQRTVPDPTSALVGPAGPERARLPLLPSILPVDAMDRLRILGLEHGEQSRDGVVAKPLQGSLSLAAQLGIDVEQDSR